LPHAAAAQPVPDGQNIGKSGQARKLPWLSGARRESVPAAQPTITKETIMQWTKPGYTDLRFGFEITMYILHR